MQIIRQSNWTGTILLCGFDWLVWLFDQQSSLRPQLFWNISLLSTRPILLLCHWLCLSIWSPQTLKVIKWCTFVVFFVHRFYSSYPKSGTTKLGPFSILPVCLELVNRALQLDASNERAIYCVQYILRFQPSLSPLIEDVLQSRYGTFFAIRFYAVLFL